FIAIASHELKTPLNPLHLILQLLTTSMRNSAEAVSEKWGAKLELAKAQVRRLDKLVEDLLELSRMTRHKCSLQLEEVDLTTLVKDVLRRFSDEFGRVGCKVTLCADGPVSGHWDRLRLEQVLSNLLSNAAKYGAHKPIEVAIEAEPERA